MKISRLSRMILIEKNTVVTDEIGNHRNVWGPYFRCHAYVTAGNDKAEEREAAGVTVEEENLTFHLRYCSEVAALTGVNYRIRFNGNVYNIRSVDRMNYDNKSVKIHATKESRVG